MAIDRIADFGLRIQCDLQSAIRNPKSAIDIHAAGVFRDGDCLGEMGDDVVGLEAFGFGVEVRHDAMPQHGRRDGANVVAADVVTAVQHGPRLGGEDQVLARRGPAPQLT